MVATAVNKTSIVCVMIKVKRFSHPLQNRIIVLRRRTKVETCFGITKNHQGFFC